MTLFCCYEKGLPPTTPHCHHLPEQEVEGKFACSGDCHHHPPPDAAAAQHPAMCKLPLPHLLLRDSGSAEWGWVGCGMQPGTEQRQCCVVGGGAPSPAIPPPSFLTGIRLCVCVYTHTIYTSYN